MTYSIRSDSEAIFGSDNITRWADLNNQGDKDEIVARISWAITEAYNQINSRLKGCRYKVPFTEIDPVILTLSARLVGVLLYDNRKLVDSNDFDEVLNHRRMVEDCYRGIHGGLVSLLVPTQKAVSYPQAIQSEAD